MIVSADSKKQVILHAPNIHNGGGLRLLNGLLNLRLFPFSSVQLDSRVCKQIKIPDTAGAHFVKNTILSRLYAEWRLKRLCQKNDVIICLNGLPPLFSMSGKTIIILQNYLLLESKMIASFPWKKKLRLWIERGWLLSFQKHGTRFIVQSKTMEQLARKQLNSKAVISLFPFVNPSPEAKATCGQGNNSDFIYVASGDPHKNHAILLDSWILLAQENIKPRLLLTVDPLFYPDLSKKISLYCDSFGLNIHNIGQVSSEEIHELYQNTKALIYPSLGESLGLPLVEALAYGLPVIAAERDYVRDVVVPVESFDPLSPLSIARAIKRFLNITEVSATFHSPSAFIVEMQT